MQDQPKRRNGPRCVRLWVPLTFRAYAATAAELGDALRAFGGRLREAVADPNAATGTDRALQAAGELAAKLNRNDQERLQEPFERGAALLHDTTVLMQKLASANREFAAAKTHDEMLRGMSAALGAVTPSPFQVISADEHLLNEREAGSFLGLSPRTLQRMRTAGDGPVYRRQGKRRVVYLRSDLLKWSAARAHKHTSAEGYKRPRKAA